MKAELVKLFSAMEQDSLPPGMEGCLRTLGCIICLLGSMLLSLLFYGMVLWWLFLPIALVGSWLVWAVNVNTRRSVVLGCAPYLIPLLCQSLYYFFVERS